MNTATRGPAAVDQLDGQAGSAAVHSVRSVHSVGSVRQPTGRQLPTRRRLLTLLPAALAGPVVGAAGLTGCATAAPPVDSPAFSAPRVRPGDRWAYREINRYNQTAVADVDIIVTGAQPLACRVERRPTETTAGAVQRHGASDEERYATAWTVLHEPTYDLTLDFAEPMPLLPAALQVGATQRNVTSFTVSGYSRRYRWDQRLRAIGAERIATPAGSFDCLVVRREIYFESPDPFRLNSSRVDQIWYAPAINRWARREWTGDYLSETSLDDRFAGRRREDWVRWELTRYTPAA
ncbi:MAG: DUF3108 domain-containing protein [Lautropia sp.]